MDQVHCGDGALSALSLLGRELVGTTCGAVHFRHLY